MPELVGVARSRLLLGSHQPSVITLGVQRVREQDSVELLSSQELTNRDSNTTGHVLHSRVWCQLHSRTSDALMIHVLMYCCMFSRLPNNCYLQISGLPLGALCFQSKAQRKYAKSTLGTGKRQGSTNNQLFIMRTQMYFASQAFAVRGLPKTHILNEIAGLERRAAAEKVILRIFRVNGKAGLMKVRKDWRKTKVNHMWIPLKQSASKQSGAARVKELQVPPLLHPLIKVLAKFIGNHQKCPYYQVTTCICICHCMCRHGEACRAI
jgi:hypothetical protein